MLIIKLENKYGELLDLTSNVNYVVKVAGLTPPPATINTTKVPTKDGVIFNSSSMDIRNIVLTIIPLQNIENSRINLYKFIKSKQYIKLYFKNGARDVWIDGYVEAIEGDLYENPQQLQVSIICADPFFKDNKNMVVDFSNVTNLFEFPFTLIEEGAQISTLTVFEETNIHNPSDDDCGAIFTLHANGLVLEPIIYNRTTNEQYMIRYELKDGDEIILNTKRGEKSLMLISEGVQTNIINCIGKGSKWLNLLSGDNVIAYTCAHGAENLNISVTLNPIYEGV